MQQKIIKVIKDTLQQRGMKQEFLCQKLEIDNTKFSQSMRGKRKLPVNEFIAICLFLKLNISDFGEIAD